MNNISDFFTSLVIYAIGFAVYYIANYLQLFLFNINIIFFVDLPCALASYVIFVGAPAFIIGSCAIFSGLTSLSKFFGLILAAVFLFIAFASIEHLFNTKDYFYLVLTIIQLFSLIITTKSILFA